MRVMRNDFEQRRSYYGRLHSKVPRNEFMTGANKHRVVQRGLGKDEERSKDQLIDKLTEVVLKELSHSPRGVNITIEY